MTGIKDSIFNYSLDLEEEYPYLKTHPAAKEFFRILRMELLQQQRPADQTILRDEHLMKILGVCKRKLQYMKSGREIPFYDPPGQKDYYILSEILDWLKQYKVETLESSRRI